MQVVVEGLSEYVPENVLFGVPVKNNSDQFFQNVPYMNRKLSSAQDSLVFRWNYHLMQTYANYSGNVGYLGASTLAMSQQIIPTVKILYFCEDVSTIDDTSDILKNTQLLLCAYFPDMCNVPTKFAAYANKYNYRVSKVTRYLFLPQQSAFVEYRYSNSVQFLDHCDLYYKNIPHVTDTNSEKTQTELQLYYLTNKWCVANKYPQLNGEVQLDEFSYSSMLRETLQVQKYLPDTLNLYDFYVDVKMHSVNEFFAKHNAGKISFEQALVQHKMHDRIPNIAYGELIDFYALQKHSLASPNIPLTFKTTSEVTQKTALVVNDRSATMTIATSKYIPAVFNNNIAQVVVPMKLWGYDTDNICSLAHFYNSFARAFEVSFGLDTIEAVISDIPVDICLLRTSVYCPFNVRVWRDVHDIMRFIPQPQKRYIVTITTTNRRVQNMWADWIQLCISIEPLASFVVLTMSSDGMFGKREQNQHLYRMQPDNERGYTGLVVYMSNQSSLSLILQTKFEDICKRIDLVRSQNDPRYFSDAKAVRTQMIQSEINQNTTHPMLQYFRDGWLSLNLSK